MHRVHIVAVKVRSWSVELACDTRRTVGYRAECQTCDYRSPVRQTVTLARVEGATHRPVAVG